MSNSLAVRTRIAFGLAFDVEKAAETRSGYKAAKADLRTGKELFGELRLCGFAALLASGFAERLVIIGGIEERYLAESISRATAIRQMLVEDMEIDPEQIEAIQSPPGTGGNISMIKAILNDKNVSHDKSAIVSNHYHLPRILLDLRATGLELAAFPAEAFWLLRLGTSEERVAMKRELIGRFGGGPLAARLAEEISGIADKLRGEYRVPVISPSSSDY